MRSSRSLGGVCAKLGAPANWAAPTATRARKPKLRVMAASIAVSAGQPSLAPHDITIVPRFGVLLQNPATIRISIQHPSLPRLEFKSGDFKPGLIAPSSLSTTRLAGQRSKGDEAVAVTAGPSLRRLPASPPAQSGMRSTGLIVVPCEESCAARLISASG